MDARTDEDEARALEGHETAHPEHREALALGRDLERTRQREHYAQEQGGEDQVFDTRILESTNEQVRPANCGRRQ